MNFTSPRNEKVRNLDEAIFRGEVEVIGWITRDSKGWPGLVFWSYEEAVKNCKPEDLHPIYVKTHED